VSGVAYSDWVREFEAVEDGPEPMLWRCLKCGVWVTDRFVHEHVRPVR